MSPTESSIPLLRPGSPDDDTTTLTTDDYYESPERSQVQYTPSSSSVSDLGPAAIIDEHCCEQKSLLRGQSPPPRYERIDATIASWTNDVEEQRRSDPIQPSGLAKRSIPPSYDDIVINVTPCGRLANFKNIIRQRQRQRRCKKCPRLCKAFLFLIIGGISTLFMLVMFGRGLFERLFICPYKHSITRNYQIQSLDHFDYSQSNDQNSGLPMGFSGIMNIMSGPSDQAVDLNVSIRSTASNLRGEKTGTDWRPANLGSCAEVTLFFRPGLEISDFRIESKKMKLVLSSDLIVSGTTTITLKKGTLVAQRFDSSREIHIDVKSSTVKGTIGLQELLSIKSKSGSVSLDINPRAALQGKPKPAVLEIESKSGSVEIRYPGDVRDIPDREYHSTIKSKSGSVNVMCLLGKVTRFETKSGSLSAQILPYGGSQDDLSLITTMESGSSTIEVLRPLEQHSNPLASMRSSHSAASGHMELRYPDEWYGSIHGKAKSGSLSLHGNDVNIFNEESHGGSRLVQARKGRGKSELEFEIRSGSVDVSVGH